MQDKDTIFLRGNATTSPRTWGKVGAKTRSNPGNDARQAQKRLNNGALREKRSPFFNEIRVVLSTQVEECSTWRDADPVSVLGLEVTTGKIGKDTNWTIPCFRQRRRQVGQQWTGPRPKSSWIDRGPCSGSLQQNRTARLRMQGASQKTEQQTAHRQQTPRPLLPACPASPYWWA